MKTSACSNLADAVARRALEENLWSLWSRPGMSMRLAELPEAKVPPGGIELREVTDETQAARLLELVGWRWAVPPQVLPMLPAVTRAFEVGRPGSSVRSWLAWRDGAPVAKVLLHLAAGAAGVYGVATIPEARGLGLARALTLEAFAAARHEGHDLGVLHSTPMARNLYEKIGFRCQADFRIFAPPHALHL